MTQAERQARVAARKRPAEAAPWMTAVAGTLNWLLVDDITVAALADGYVTARLQAQARRLARYLEGTETGPGTG